MKSEKCKRLWIRRKPAANVDELKSQPQTDKAGSGAGKVPYLPSLTAPSTLGSRDTRNRVPGWLYTIFQRTVRKFKANHKGRPYDKEVVNACIDSVKEEMPPERNISLPPLDEIHECVEALFPTPEPVADTDATDATNVPTTFDVTKPEDITLEQCVASVEAMMAKIQ